MSYIVRVICQACGRMYAFDSDDRLDFCPLCGAKR